MELSRYIEAELAGLMRQVEATPPRRYTSLQRIKTLVESAPLEQQQARKITQSIQKIENAIRQYSTPNKKKKQDRLPQNVTQPQFDKLSIRQLMERKMQGKAKEGSVEWLEGRYEQVRRQREGLESYLRELVAKVQRLERVKASQQEWQTKARAKSAIDRELAKRIDKMRNSRRELHP